MSNVSNVRALAAETLYNVVDKGASLNQELPFASQGLSPKDKALLQQICYGVLRYLPSLENYCQHLVEQPLKGKRRIFQLQSRVHLTKYDQTVLHPTKCEVAMHHHIVSRRPNLCVLGFV